MNLSGITQDNMGKKVILMLNWTMRLLAPNQKWLNKDKIFHSQIRDIVNNQININHLGNTIINNQKNQIINLLIEIRDLVL